MNDDLTWQFDVTAIEWLIVLSILIILAVVDAVATRRCHYKAFKKPNAMVMREGGQMSIRAEELVPGDIVLLQSGDKVPADLRLFRVKGLQIQEAALTAAFVFATNPHGR